MAQEKILDTWLKNEIIIKFAEGKWSNKSVGTNIYEVLKRKFQKVEWSRKDRREYFALFSKSGFTSEMEKMAGKGNIYLFHEDRLVLP